jgi:hypothetical protein
MYGWWSNSNIAYMVKLEYAYMVKLEYAYMGVSRHVYVWVVAKLEYAYMNNLHTNIIQTYKHTYIHECSAEEAYLHVYMYTLHHDIHIYMRVDVAQASKITAAHSRRHAYTRRKDAEVS